MKLIDGIKEKGNPFWIPDCSREELPEFFKELGFKVGAEIGVYKGQFTEKFCQKGLKMSAIDNWQVYLGGAENHQAQERQDVLYKKTMTRLSNYDCTVIRKNSLDALSDFEPGSLDFVYLDADHSFRGIADDIYEWYRKVRSGGIISGHDYACADSIPWAHNEYCKVGEVVDAFIKAFDIENYYVFGRSKPLELEAKNDRYLSWMFLKP